LNHVSRGLLTGLKSYSVSYDSSYSIILGLLPSAPSVIM